MKISVMLISKMESTLSAIRRLIADEEISVIGDSSGGSKALDKIENQSPDVVIMSMGVEDMDVLNLAERIILHKPKTFVIIVMEVIDLESLQAAMKIGAHNIIELPKTSKELCDYIKVVYNNENTRINSLSEKQSISWASKVVTVFGSKGGLGKTTISANLAVELAKKGKKVALIDLDLQFGDVHIFLDLEPKDTIAEFVQEVYTPSIDSVRSYMMIHSSGVHVLCAPKSPEYAEIISVEKIQNLLSIMRNYYDYVIIDTPPTFNEITITAIESSQTVLFVTGLDISILKNSKLSMSLLDSLQQKDKVKIIVNRAVEMNSITVHDVQKILTCPIWARIPSDYKVAVSALNRGIPFVIGSPQSKLSQSISEIGELIVSGSKDYDIQKFEKKERNNLFGKYFKGKKIGPFN